MQDQICLHKSTQLLGDGADAGAGGNDGDDGVWCGVVHLL